MFNTVQCVIRHLRAPKKNMILKLTELRHTQILIYSNRVQIFIITYTVRAPAFNTNVQG